MTSLGTSLAVAQAGAARLLGFHCQPFGLCTCKLLRGVVAPVAHLPAGSSEAQYALCPVLLGRIVWVGPGDWVKQI